MIACFSENGMTSIVSMDNISNGSSPSASDSADSASRWLSDRLGRKDIQNAEASKRMTTGIIFSPCDMTIELHISSIRIEFCNGRGPRVRCLVVRANCARQARRGRVYVVVECQAGRLCDLSERTRPAVRLVRRGLDRRRRCTRLVLDGHGGVLARLSLALHFPVAQGQASVSDRQWRVGNEATRNKSCWTMNCASVI